ncbi:hypothetical protein GJ496_007122 [Pomphorhynchus laevis]|nr:hypothetical protein GJ496_007122 [Pomphorhynchus laevis]
MQFNDSDVILGFKEVRNYSLNDSKGKHKRKCIKKQKKLESSLSFKAISKSKISKRGNDKSKTVSTSVLSYAGKFESTTIGDEDLCDWKHLNLPEPILQSLKVQEFYQPTSIQNAVISNALLSRKHVAIAAPTGSGKTLCYAIPILSRLIENNWDKANNDRLYSLVLVPTRELAIQVKNHMQNLSAFTEVKVLD